MKFGVGFKAVFQYTNTPYIYDPNFKFKIERFVIPRLLDHDFEGRKEYETVFVFPFDHPEKTMEECYNDILAKLKSLKYPTLFLNSLLSVDFFSVLDKGKYYKKAIDVYDFDDTNVQRLCLSKIINGKEDNEYLYLFTRKYENLIYCIGYKIDEDCNLLPSDNAAFCFFPTKEETKLNFIIHAPFLLTDSRESIKSNENHNKLMVNLLANLSADSLLMLKEIGNREGKKIISDSIVDIIPTNSSLFSQIDSTEKISFLPIYNAIKDKLKSEEIIPTDSGFVSSSNACWASVQQVVNLLPRKQLNELLGKDNDEYDWAFPTLGFDNLRRVGKSYLYNYLIDIIKSTINEDYVISHISSAFIAKQSTDWLIFLYNWINETPNRKNRAKTYPIFKDTNGKPVSAMDSYGNHLLYLPSDFDEHYSTINSELYEYDVVKELLNYYSIEKPELIDEIEKIIIPSYSSNSEITKEMNLLHLKKLIEYYKNCPQIKLNDFYKELYKVDFLACDLPGENNKKYRCSPSVTYRNTLILQNYFLGFNDIYLLNEDYYFDFVQNEKEFYNFITDLGISDKLRIKSRLLSISEIRNKKINYYSYKRYIEYSFECLEKNIDLIINTNDYKKSLAVWNLLCMMFSDITSIKKQQLKYIIIDLRGSETFSGETSFIYDKLVSSKWLVNKNNEFIAPKDVLINELLEDYDTESIGASSLMDFLEIGGLNRINVTDIEENNTLTDEQKEEAKLGRYAIENGITMEELAEFIKLKKKQEESNVEIVNHPTEVIEVDEKFFEESYDAEDEEDSIDYNEKRERLKNLVSITKDVVNKAKNKNFDDSDIEEKEIDQDDMIPNYVDYDKKIKNAENKSAKDIDLIERLKKLQDKAMSSPKYSFGWFKALIELEIYSNSEFNNQKSFYIRLLTNS